MVGNGVTNWTVDCDGAYIDMAYWHGLISDEMYDGIETFGCRKQFENIEFKDP